MRDLAKYFGVYKKTDRELREMGHEMISPKQPQRRQPKQKRMKSKQNNPDTVVVQVGEHDIGDGS